jgi:hypothetical protein
MRGQRKTCDVKSTAWPCFHVLFVSIRQGYEAYESRSLGHIAEKWLRQKKLFEKSLVLDGELGCIEGYHAPGCRSYDETTQLHLQYITMPRNCIWC